MWYISHPWNGVWHVVKPRVGTSNHVLVRGCAKHPQLNPLKGSTRNHQLAVTARTWEALAMGHLDGMGPPSAPIRSVWSDDHPICNWSGCAWSTWTTWLGPKFHMIPPASFAARCIFLGQNCFFGLPSGSLTFGKKIPCYRILWQIIP